MFEEDGGLYTLIQNHLFLDMVISVQIVSLRFDSRSLSLLVIIPFFKCTNLALLLASKKQEVTAH